MRRLILRIRIWWVEKSIDAAENCLNRLHHDLPEMHSDLRDMLQELWSLESDHPA